MLYTAAIVGGLAVMEKWDIFLLLGPILFALVTVSMATPLLLIALGLSWSGKEGATGLVVAFVAILLSSAAIPGLVDSPRQEFVRKAGSVTEGMSLEQVGTIMQGYRVRSGAPNFRSYSLSSSPQSIDILILKITPDGKRVEEARVTEN